MTDKVRYVFMEVGPFNKTLEECSTFEEQFLYYIKNLPTFVEKPDTHNNPYFEDLLMEAEYLKMDNETQAQYERRLMQIWDAKNVEAYMIKTTLAEGREKGLAEGRAEGRAEGLEKGMAQGYTLTIKALSMLKEGRSIQEICQATGLSEDNVLELQQIGFR